MVWQALQEVALASFSRLSHRQLQAFILLVGLLVVLVGVILARAPEPSYWATTLLSVGSSVIAAAIVASLSPVSWRAYERFLSLGIGEVYPSRNHVDDRQWVKWLRQADRSCVLFGIAHGNWCRDAEFEGALVERLTRGVAVEVFFLNPNGPAAELRAREDKGRNTRNAIQTSIQVLWEIRGRLSEKPRSNLKVYVYDATPSLGLTWIDEFMVVTHYLAGSMNLTSPALLVKPAADAGGDRDLYAIYAKNVKSIKAEFATDLTDANVQQYLHKA